MRNKGVVVSVEGFKSDFDPGAKGAETLDFSATSLGQSYPQRCPQSIEPARSPRPLGLLGDVTDLVQTNDSLVIEKESSLA